MCNNSVITQKKPFDPENLTTARGHGIRKAPEEPIYLRLTLLGGLESQRSRLTPGSRIGISGDDVHPARFP